MAEGLDSIKQQLNHYWEKLNSTQKRSFIIIAGIVMLIIVISAFLLSKKEYVVLYSGLDRQEAAEIYTKLNELKAEPKLEGTSTILVPKDKEAELRMNLTMEGYPRSGLNYDLFFDNSGFGQTDEEKRVLLTMQLQERLSQTICFMEGIDDAVVTIAMPETDSFVLKSQQVPVTASVIIKLKPGYTITNVQASNIVQLVATSVPGLKNENVTIIDTNMNVLNNESSDEQYTLNNQFDLEHQLEDRVKKQITDLLEPVFGYRKIVATVNVKLNFDKKVKESVTFEPVTDDAGLIASRENLKEKVRNSTAGGAAGETSNTTQYPELQNDGDSTYDKSHEIVNFEVNEIKEIIEEQQGRLENLSISVIIDNEGLDHQTIEQVKELIATAIGTDLTRVTVHNMKFDTSLQEKLLESFEKREEPKHTMPISTLLLIAACIGVLVTAAVLFRKRKARLEAAAAQEVLAEAIAKQAAVEEIDLESGEHNQIRIQLDKFASQKPEAVAQLLRNWISED